MFHILFYLITTKMVYIFFKVSIPRLFLYIISKNSIYNLYIIGVISKPFIIGQNGWEKSIISYRITQSASLGHVSTLVLSFCFVSRTYIFYQNLWTLLLKIANSKIKVIYILHYYYILLILLITNKYVDLHNFIKGEFNNLYYK